MPNRSNAEQLYRVIFEHAARISRAEDTDSLLRLNADLARDLVSADRCSIWLVDAAAQELWTKVAHGVDEIRIPRGFGIVGACVAGNQPIVVNDTAGDPRFHHDVDSHSGYRTSSVVTVPLHADGKVIGALQALNKPGGFSESDVELLGLMASYSASAIQAEFLRREAEAARLLYRDLEIARDVQTRLLPQDTPEAPGIECAGFCRSARMVGGDYYDFVALPDGLFAITLGDVSGKGISAAVLMASIQALLRSQLLRAPMPVSALMNELNLAVYRCSTVDRYSTLFCGVFDAKRTKLTYVNAGQVEPIVVRFSGPEPSVQRPGEGGFPIGLLDGAQYKQGTVELGRGDIVVCFSDGISEATNGADEFWGDEDVQKVLLDNRNASARQLVEKVVEAADGFVAGAEQSDDMTIVAARIL